MRHATQRLFLAATLLASCEPGTGSVFRPDQGAVADATPVDSGTAADTRSAVDAHSAPHDLGPTTTDGGADTGPDLPAGPARLWTAEVDGTIAWWTFDATTGALTRDGSIERGGNLNFLAFSPDRSRLYALNQDRVEAFDITSLPPTFLGDAFAGLSDTGTHLAVDGTGSHVFVAWYGGDAVSMLPLGPDGTPADATVVLGGAAAPDFCRRAHQVRVHPNNRFVYVPCLASDRVAVLAYDRAAGTLTSASNGATLAGAGPRHLDFHPTLPQAYVIGELDDTITRFAVDAASGALSRLDVVSTRPAPADPLGPASDVHVSPDGRWVVGINRNPRDEVVTFAAAADGSLSAPRWVPTGGEHARTFAFSPRGDHLVLGNSNSMDLTVFTFADGNANLRETIDGFDARVFFVGFE